MVICPALWLPAIPDMGDNDDLVARSWGTDSLPDLWSWSFADHVPSGLNRVGGVQHRRA